MELTFFGHAAVGLETASGVRLLVDPYEPGGLRGAIRYTSIDWNADFVVCSHDHDDHSAVEGLPDPAPRRVERGEAGPFAIRRFSFAHDEYDGERFGGESDALRIATEDWTVVHAGDIGQSPQGGLPEPLRGPDVALIPIGGFYTVGAAQAWEWCRRLEPLAAVPIHYATDACELPLHEPETFLAHADRTRTSPDSRLQLPKDLSARGTTVVRLRPLRSPN